MSYFGPYICSKKIVAALPIWLEQYDGKGFNPRKYDKPQTPYQRLMYSNELSKYQQERFREQFESLNPIQLRNELNDQIKRFKRFVDGRSDFKYKFSA